MKKSVFNCYDFLSFPIFVLDKSFKIVFWNKSIENLSGLLKSDVKEKDVFEIYPHLNTTYYKERIKSVIDSGLTDTFTPQLNHKFIPLKLKNGKQMVQKTVVSPAIYEQGRFAVFSIHDQTDYEKKVIAYRHLKDKANEEIKKREDAELMTNEYMDKLRQSNEDLNEFAQVISHDLKAPLRGVKRLISWIMQDNEAVLPEESKNQFGLLDTTINKMEEMIGGLLSYAKLKPSSEDEQEVDLNKVVNEVIALYPKNNIKIAVNSTLPVLKINKYKIEQVFQNLINNAIKHNDKELVEINVKYTESDKVHVISIQDNGLGIKPDDYDKIFTIFKTLNQSPDNHGLGLAIIKKIITGYGGKVWVESELGKSSTFLFSLPKF